MSRELLAGLGEQVRRIERPTAMAHGVAPFGVAAIDRVLPGGGLARGALHEILGSGGDEEDGALPAAFTAAILGRLTLHPGLPLLTGEGTRGGIVLWCLPRPDLYGPGLAALGLDRARLVLVRAARDADIQWAMEEGLGTAGVIAAVGEVGVLSALASRRLQLAAERTGATALVLRRWRNGEEAARERNLPNAAATRWRVAALPSRPIAIPHLHPNSPSHSLLRPHPNPHPLAGEGMEGGSLGRKGWGERVTPMARRDAVPLTLPSPHRGGRGFLYEPGVGHPRWQVELLRCRGGAPAGWEVEIRKGKMADATDTLPVAAALADRPPTAGGNGFRPERIRRTG